MDRIYGLTFSGDSTNTPDGTGLDPTKITEIIPQLCKSPTIAVVMFVGISPATYIPILEAIKNANAKVMLRVCDSTDMHHYSVSEYATLYRKAAQVLSPLTDIFECANEVSGSRGDYSWPGPQAYAKMCGALREIDLVKKETAVTLYWNNNDPEWVWNWCATSPFEADYVLMSDYPNSTSDAPTPLDQVILNLSDYFPHSTVGFGEYGTEDEQGNQTDPTSMIQEFESRQIVEPNDIGGGFFWDAYKYLTSSDDTILKEFNLLWGK